MTTKAGVDVVAEKIQEEIRWGLMDLTPMEAVVDLLTSMVTLAEVFGGGECMAMLAILEPYAEYFAELEELIGSLQEEAQE